MYLACMDSPFPTLAHYEALKAENEALKAKNEQLRTQYMVLFEKLARLEHEMAQLKRRTFGRKSERLKTQPAEQRPAPEITKAEKPKQKPVRQALPERLPRQVVVIEPQEDTSGLTRIGEEVTETLAYLPAQLVVLRRIRPKYVDPNNPERGVIIAELPDRPIAKGMAEPSLLAQILIEKYLDHLPLYRQRQRFKREGIPLAESTLEGWVAQVADLVEPLYQRLSQEVVASGYVQADETTIAVLDQTKQGATHRGYYWVYHAPERHLVVMDYQKGRSSDGPKAFLKGYMGALQSDGYVAYETLRSGSEQEQIICYGCWAHARRKFYEAQENAPEQAAYVLQEIGRLYEIECQLRESRASAEERCTQRRARSVPILRALKAYLEANPGLPKSPWGQAAGYSLKQWDKLTGYVDDGRIELDNNLVENAIRPIVLGRKNYLFAGSHEAAQRAAVVYSLLGTCKKLGVHPHEWLSDVLSRIAAYPVKQVGDLLPHRWKAARANENGGEDRSSR